MLVLGVVIGLAVLVTGILGLTVIVSVYIIKKDEGKSPDKWLKLLAYAGTGPPI